MVGPATVRAALRRREIPGIYGTARFLILVRVLLLAVGLGILTLGSDLEHQESTQFARSLLAWLLVVSAGISALIAIGIRWFNRAWKLVLPLVLDVLWIGLFCYGSGGVDSPAVPLLFAVCLTTLLVVPGTVPFVMPALGSLVLAGAAVTYLADLTPYPSHYLAANPQLIDPIGILGTLVVQVAGLFTVDGLGQILTRRLRDQRVLTDVVLNQLGEGVVVVSRDHLVIYANQEALRLLGVTQQSLGLPVERVLEGGVLAPVRALLARDQLPVLERFAGPGDRALVLRVSPLADRRQQRSGRVLLVADETRLVVLEDSARRAERLAALGEMAAGIAHEIRNPLTSLRGCAQELGAIVGTQGSPDAAELVRVMLGEADRLARIVDDVLTLSRLRAGERQSCQPTEVAQDLAILLRHEGSGVPVAFTVADDCPAFTADEDQIRQVLLNLITNARDAVQGVAEPQVRVTFREDTGELLGTCAVRIDVTDNGCGIPEGSLERIFTPFYTTKARGTGLGLLMVQRIVREHEGLLRVASTVGVGTTITVIMPAHSQTRTFRRALGGG